MYYSREDAKEAARQQKPDFLQRAKKSGYVCPQCGNGTGSSGDGIALDKKDGKHYKCFKCGLYADIFDLYGLSYGLSDDAEIFRQVYEHYGIEIEPQERESMNKTPQKRTLDPPPQADQQEEQPANYMSFYKQAAAQNDFSYLKERGISEETQRHFMIGYAPAWVHPKAPNAPATPRCIIPTSSHSYLARDTRKDVPEQQKKYVKSKVGQVELFNTKYMGDEKTVFVVEGEIDAMSIYEASAGEAYPVGLGTTSKREAFVKYAQEHYTGQIFVLMLDNDEPGREAQEALKADLQRAGMPVLEGAYNGNDPNNALMTDREGLQKAISFLQEDAERLRNDNKYNAAELLDYFKSIETQPPGFEVKTGFENLDNNLSGGLHEGLIVIGAISSLGKTTFTLQLADQIAAAGQDVIFFSLEMSKYELMAKSISRNTYKRVRDKKTADGAHYLARDTVQILNNRKYQYYTQEEKQIIADAIKDYEAPAEHLYIYEGRYRGQRLTVQHIREIVKNHVESTMRKPVVIVDYLQILAPADTHLTDKQATDDATFELKEISRDYTIPVIAISSFNRENYSEPATMACFKESGAIEYSSDILFGLQYEGMEYQDGEKKEDRQQRLRELNRSIQNKKRLKEAITIELKCLKSRNGYTFTIPFYMVSAFNHLEETHGFRPMPEGAESPFDNPFDKYRRNGKK